MKGNIILVGFMGTGKTTIGKILAQKTAYRFIDSDDEIVKQTEISIPDLFEEYGEKYFRDLEHKIIVDILSHPNQVVATGGGAVLSEDNYDVMKKNGTVIALEGSVEVLWERLQKDKSRPMLYSENPKKRMETLYRYRQPLYRRADILISIDGKTPEQIVEEIVAQMKKI